MTREKYADSLGLKVDAIERVIPVLEERRSRRVFWKRVLGCITLIITLFLGSKLAFQLEELHSSTPLTKFVLPSLALISALCSGFLTFWTLAEDAGSYLMALKQLAALRRKIELKQSTPPDSAKGREEVVNDIIEQLTEIEQALHEPFPRRDLAGGAIILGEAEEPTP